jgi:hypothetical protein
MSKLKLNLSKVLKSKIHDADFVIIDLNATISEVVFGMTNPGCDNSGCDSGTNPKCKNTGCETVNQTNDHCTNTRCT